MSEDPLKKFKEVYKDYGELCASVSLQVTG